MANSLPLHFAKIISKMLEFGFCVSLFEVKMGRLPVLDWEGTAIAFLLVPKFRGLLTKSKKFFCSPACVPNISEPGAGVVVRIRT